MINHSTALPRIVEHKALLMVHHFRWWESKIGEKMIKNTAFSYLDTYDGVPAELMATLHPEIQKRIDHDALVAKVTSAGEPIPEAPIGLGDLPSAMPAHPGDLPPSASSARHAVWKIGAESFESGEECRAGAKSLALSMLDAEDMAAVTNLGGPLGLLKVTSPMIWRYMFSTYDNLTADLIANYRAKVEKDFDRAISLRGNFEEMKRAAEILKLASKELEYSPNQMFQRALSICAKDQYRLRSIANQFTRAPGYSYLLATFDPFMAHMIRGNSLELHEVGTGNKAFSCEADYVAHSTPKQAFGFAAPVIDSSQAFALGAVNARPPAPPPPPPARPPAGPRPARVGVLCFVHGWNTKHTSTVCRAMENNPAYTDAQRAVVAIPRGHPAGTPYIVDGKTCNQKCYRGILPAP
jgi:hypothetical protein